MAELRGGGAVVAAGEVQGTHEWLVQSSALCTAGLRLIEHLGFTKVGSVSRPTGSLIRVFTNDCDLLDISVDISEGSACNKAGSGDVGSRAERDIVLVGHFDALLGGHTNIYRKISSLSFADAFFHTWAVIVSSAVLGLDGNHGA